MTLPVGFPYPLKQEVEIPLEQIIPNPDQPRKLENKEAIQLLAASMRAKGQEVAARVRPLTEEERIAHPGAWVMLIGGHGRREAALANQFKTLKCTVEDIAPEETLSASARDNSIRKMHWWEWYLVIEGVDKASPKSQKVIGDELVQSQTRVSRALKITKTLNPAARVMVLENLQKTLKNDDADGITKNKDFSITELTLLTLAGLEDPDQVQQALQVVLDDYLTADQTKKLIEHIQAGNPASTFDLAKTATKTPKVKTKVQAVTVHSPESTTPVVAAEPSADHSPTQQKASRTPTTLQQPASSPMGTAETLTWDVALGISILAKIKAKVKKGERPTFGEALLLVGDKLVHLLIHLTRWVAKHGIKGVFRVIKWVWRALMEALKELGLYKPLRSLLLLVLVVLILVTAWDIHERGWMHPVQFLIAHLPQAKTEPKVPTAEPTPSPSANQALGQSSLVARLDASQQMPSANQALGQSSLVARLDASQQMPHQPRPVAIASSSEIKTILPMQAYVESQSSVEDQKYLEMEIATLPHYSRVKDFPFTPLPMNADMASRRLADIQDSDKYKVFWGSDQQSVISITPTASNCTLMFKGGLEGLLGSTGKMEIYWEDVKCIHCSEIAAGLGKDAHTYFQFSLVVPAIKKPLTVQCDSAVELGHLISSLEFWLKTSRGTTAPLVGFPYLNQGLWLKGDNEVGALWANSTADKAGLQLGDFFWSVGKNTLDPQHHAAFEKALQSPQNTFFVVSPVDWKKAQAPPINAPSNYFNPKRRKVTLTP